MGPTIVGTAIVDKTICQKNNFLSAKMIKIDIINFEIIAGDNANLNQGTGSR